MIKKLTTAALSCALLGSFSCAYADSHGASADAPNVTFNGSLGFALVDQDSNQSWEMKNTKARLGVKSMQSVSIGKLMGQMEFDYDNGSNSSTQSGDSDEIDVRIARVVLILPGKHMVNFAGRTPSGNYADNYAHVDIFDGGGYHFFQQPDFAGTRVGYKSPKFGGVHVGAAVIATDPTNDEDQDALHFRVAWDSGPWHVGYGHVESKASTASDSARETLSFIYEDGPLMVGLTHEDKLRGAGTLDGDTVLGIAASYTAGVHAIRAASYSQDSDSAASDGLSATTLEYSMALNDNSNFFVTVDQFDLTSTTDDSATVFGINMSW